MFSSMFILAAILDAQLNSFGLNVILHNSS